MIRLLKIAVLSFSFLFISNWLFGQASVVNNGNFPRHETLDQHTIEVRFNAAITGTATATDWTVQINGTSVTVNSATRINAFDVAIVFQASDVNPGQNFLLPGQTLTVRFINSSGSITTVAGGAPANASGGFITSVNKVVATCSDVTFLQQGLITLPVAKTPDICSPVVEDFTQYQYYLSLRVRNSVDYNAGNLIHQINWGDGVTTNEVSYTSDASGVPSAAFYDQTAFGAGNPGVIMTSRPSHNYPPTLPLTGGDCSWNATVTPVLNFAAFTACSGETKTTNFATYDTDNKNTGSLNLPPFPLPTSNLVCRGTNVGMQFSDNTLLNCRLAVEPTVPNQRARAIRFTYGSTNFGGVGNVPDIRITLPAGVYGAQPSIPITNNDATGTLIFPGGYFPTNVGPSDGNGVIILPASVTVATALTYAAQITTVDPTKQVVGQRFYIRMEYWDVCNPYNPLIPATLGDAESIENFVEIITKPPIPVANNKEFCAGTTLNPGAATCAASTAANQLISFELTAAGVAGSTAINWYFGNPTSGGVLLTNSYGTNCRFFRSGALASTGAQGTMRTAMAAGTPGVYSLWATYNITNGCTSDPVEVKLTVRPALTAPAAPTGLTDVCNGSSAIYTLASAPLNRTILPGTITNTANVVFPTEYLWTASAADVTFGTVLNPNPSIQDNITAAFNIATQPPTSTPRGVGAALQYRTATNNATNNRCTTTPNNNLTVNVFGVTVGGTVSADQSICNGSAFATLTLTGQRGNVVRWERTGPGGLATIAHTGTTLTSVTEPFPPNGPGVYTYYAVVRNGSTGPCSEVNSAAATITVNPIPPKPIITQGAGSAGLTICENGADQVVLQSDNVGGIGATYRWFRGATLVQNSASNTLTLDNAAQSGSYTVQLVGPATTVCPGPLSDPVAVVISPLPTATVTGGGSSCNGIAASDIVWTLTGTPPFNFTITASTAEPGFPINVIGHTSNTYTIVAPNPAAATNYQMTALTDVTTCPSASLGGIASVTPQAVLPPSVDSFLGQPDVCDAGATTNPPDAILDLNPNSIQNYAISYRLRRMSTGLFLPATISFTQNSDALGVINISPSYIDFGAVPNDPLGYQVVITAIQNVGTGCAGAVPINGPTLIINPRPATPVNPVPGTACSSDATGAPISVDDPGAGFEIDWSSGVSANLADFVAATGTVSGTNNLTFTPTGTNTFTYYAFSRNTATGCVSATGRAVQHNRDILPTNVNPDSDNNTANNRTCTSSFALVAATPLDGTGTWTGPAGVTFTNASNPSTTVNNLPLTPGTPTVTQLTWTVRSTLNVCSPIVTTIDITRNPLPDAIDPQPILCDPGTGSVTGIDLDTYNDVITGITGSTDRTIQWFSNSARTISVPDIHNVTAVITPQTRFYNIVTNTVTGCTSNGQITFTVRPLPIANNHSTQICEDMPPGSLQATGINLTIYESTITGGAANRDVEWYTDPGLAAANLIPAGSAIGAEENYSISADVTLYAKVIDVTLLSPQCFKVATMGLDYQARPNNNQIRDGNNAILGATYSICASSSLILLQIDPSLNPGSSYTWNVPTPVPSNQFELLTGTNGVFIILKFPNAIPSPGIPISVTETLGTAGCAGNTLTTNIIVDSSPPKPQITGRHIVCSGENGIEFEVPLIGGSTYSWSLPPGATITSLPVTSNKITVQMSSFSGNVTVVQSSGNGCTSDPADPFPVTVVPRPSISSATATLCSGQSVSDVYMPSSAIAGTTYNWEVINVTGFVGGSLLGDNASGVTSIGQTLTNTSGITATVTYRVTPVGPPTSVTVTYGSPPTTVTETTSCPGTPQNVTITVNPEPSLSLTNKTLCSNEPAAYEIKLSPVNLPVGTTFSWSAPTMSDGSVQGTPSGGNVPMGPAGTIHISDAFVNTTSTAITATYTLSATSGQGCVSHQSAAFRQVVFTINPEPVGADITRATQCSNVAFSVSANNISNGLGATSTYTWVRNPLPAGLTQVAAGTGSGAIAETLRNLTNATLTAEYVVTATSANGCIGATYVVSVPITPQPVGTATTKTAVCSDDSFNFDPQSDISNAVASTFTWTAVYDLGSGQLTGGAGSGTGVISETLSNVSATVRNAVYTITPTSIAGTCAGSSFVMTVPVKPKPTGLTTIKAAQCSGSGFSFNPQSDISNSVTSTFSWTAIYDAGSGNLTGGAGVGTGVIAETLINLSGGTLNAVYEITPVSNPGGCIGAPFYLTVPVNSAPLGADITRAAQCSNVALNLSADNITNGMGPTSTYTWVRDPLPAGLTQITAGTGFGNIAETLQNLTNSQLTATYVVTPQSASGCTGATYVISVPVNPRPVSASSSKLAQCSNAVFSFDPQLNISNGVTSSFTWTAVYDGGSGQITGGSGSGTGLIAETLINLSGSLRNVVYTVIPTSLAGGCTGASFQIIVPITSEPVGNSSTRTAQCSDVAFSFNPQSNVTNGVVSTFSWAAIYDAGLTGGSGSGNGLIAETLTNVTGGTLNAVYTVTPSVGACAGNTFQITVPVNSEPLGADITRTPQCSNLPFSLSANNITNGMGGTSTYTWVRNTLPAGLTQVTAGSGGGNIAETLRNLTGATLNAEYVVTPHSADGCVGNTYVVRVPVLSEPVGSNAIRTAQCSNSAFSVSSNNITNGMGATSTYAWTRSALPAGLTEVTAGSGVGDIAEILRNLTSGTLNASYVVTPTSASGCAGASYVIEVPIRPEPVGGNATKAAQCSNVPFTFNPQDNITNSVNATFTWTAIYDAGLTGGAGTGTGSLSETLINSTGGSLNATYTVLPKAVTGGCDGVAFQIIVPVNSRPVGADITRAAQCSNIAFSVSANNITNGMGGASTFTWIRDPLPAGLVEVTAGTGTGNIAETLRNQTSGVLSAVYVVIPKSGDNCEGPSYRVTVPITPEPVGAAVTTITRCSGQSINYNLMTIINGSGGNTVASKFRYTVVSDFPLDVSPAVFPGTFDRTTASTALITETFSNYSNHDVTLTYTVTPINVTGDCAGDPFTLKVVYRAEPVGSNFTEPNCNTALNHNIQTTQITNGLASTFTYTISQSPTGALTLPANRTVASDAPITDTYVNLTGNPVVVTYTIQAFNKAFPSCAAAATFTYTVTISPKPTGTSDTKSAVCSDGNFVLDPQGNISPNVPSTFAWTATYDGVAIPSGSGVISASFHNSSNTAKNVVYTIIPTAIGSGCEGPSFVITVPISPEPVINPALANPTPNGVCSTNAATPLNGNNINVILNTNGTSVAADTYIITLKSKDAGLTGTPTVGTFAAAGGTSNAIAGDHYRNVTSAQLKVVYTVVPKIGNCFGDAFDITVLINPEPVLDNTGARVCSTNTLNQNPIGVILGTNGTSVNASSYIINQIQYSNGGPFSTSLPANFTRIASTGTGADLIRNDKYNNTSGVAITVRYTIQGKSPSPSECLSEAVDIDVIIDPEPILSPNTADVCSGLPTGLILTSAAGSSAITSYELISVVPVTGSTGLTADASNAIPGVYTSNTFLQSDKFYNVSTTDQVMNYTVVPISGLCKGTKQVIAMTVHPAPAFIASMDAKVCSNSISGIVFVDNSISNVPQAVSPFSVAAVNYDIISVTVDAGLTVVTVSSTGLTGTGSGNINTIKNDQFINTTTDPLFVTYKVVPISASGCRGPEKTIVLTVEPKIMVNVPFATTPDLCSGTSVNIVLSSPTNPTPNPNALPDPLITFNYLMTPVTGISGNSSASNVGQGFVITDQLVNNTNSAITVHYKVTAFANSAADGKGCSSDVLDVPITVQPKPKLIPTRLVQAVCEGTAIAGVTLNSPTVASGGNGNVIFELISVVDPLTNVVNPTNVAGYSAAGKIYNVGDALNDALTNTSMIPPRVPQTIRYTLRPRFSAGLACAGDDVSIEITINPRPEVTPSATALEICSSEFIEVQLPVNTESASTIVRWIASASSVDVVGESSGAGDVLFQTLLNNSSTPQTVTYTITPSFNGCDGTPKILTVRVNPVPKFNSTSSPPVLSSRVTVCDGTVFNLNLMTYSSGATTFRWEVTDVNNLGTANQFDGNGTAINQSFVNNGDASATLIYQITPIFEGTGTLRCEGIPRTITISIAPHITALIDPADAVCEGTPVFLVFELQGQAPFDFVYSATDASGTVNKSITKSGNIKVEKVTPTSTTTYKVLSVKDALGCPVTFTAPEPSQMVTVYQKVTASWTASIPPFVGGNATVGFTNTSTPVDGSVFNYEWSFGTDSYVNPLTSNGVGPFSVNYSRPGDHYVTLVASNRFAPVELGCESTFSAKITIPVLPLMADFKFDPKAACFPQDITITENTATGVAMDWQVKASDGRVAATSTAPLPIFQITSPGVYTISLRTYDPFTHAEAYAPTAGKTFTIYDNPVASFDVRPTLVYVPDTELTTFNFSTGAPEYLWDFGDGSISTEPEPKYTYKIEGIYDITLVAINDHGDGAVCTDTLSRKITAKQGGVTKVPNAFTPSPNGPSGGIAGNNTFNDVFLPIVKGAEEFNMQIFDRWGNLIFESNNSNMGWDGYDKNGKLMPAGVYVYKLTVRLSDGQRSTQIGDITMIR